LTPSTKPYSSETQKAGAPYVFELFVCGMTKKSLKTITAVKSVLEHELPGDYTLAVIDIFKNPLYTKETQIITTPALIRKTPLPKRHIAGTITGKDRILQILT